MKLAKIAARIDKHLDRMAATTHKGKFFYPAAHHAGRYVMVRYVSYQGTHSMTKDEAAAYLAWLDAGNNGRHFEWQRAQKDGV